MELLYVYLAVGMCVLAYAMYADENGELFGFGKYSLFTRVFGSLVVVLLWPAFSGAVLFLVIKIVRRLDKR